MDKILREQLDAIDAVLTTRARVEMDRADSADEFPTDAVAALDSLGLYEYYIPESYGGKFRDMTAAVSVSRHIARCSVSLAVAHAKTFLGAVTAWLGSDPAKAARVAAIVHEGSPVSWGLTERNHGSDLLADEMHLTYDERGEKRLSGEKWLINNATRSGALVLLVRSARSAWPRFDLILFDKRTHPESSYHPMDKELTYGIRGADISGISIHDAVIDERDIISQPGHGLQMVVLGLQVTRTLCCSLSLGAADQALTTAYRFASRHTLCGHTLISLPQTRAILLRALADHLLNEAFTAFVTRSAQTLPGELSIHSGAAKFLVPTRTEAMLKQLRSLVGTQSFLDNPTSPVMGRIERDHRIVSLFDGNTVVNLASLIGQFNVLSQQHPSSPGDMAVTCNLDIALDPFDFADLTLYSRHGSSLLNSLPDVVDMLPSTVARKADRVVEAMNATLTDIAAETRSAVDNSSASFASAEKISLCMAAAATLNIAVYTPARTGNPLWKNHLWMDLVLDRVLEAIDGETPVQPMSDSDEVLDAVGELFDYVIGQRQGFALFDH